MRGNLRRFFYSAALMLFFTSSAQAQDCDRACLEGFMNQTMDAMLAHDSSILPLSDSFHYTENGQVIALDDGLWMTYSKHSDYQLYVSDPYAGQIAYMSVIEEGETPVIAHFRMKVEDQQIDELEVLIARGSNFPQENLITPKASFLETLPEDQRVSREELVQAADAYFSGLDEENSGANVPFHPDCKRQENGNWLANNPTSDSAMIRLSCRAQFDTGFSTIVTDIRERRYLVLDEERGLSYAIVFFDHDGTPTSMGSAEGPPRAPSAPFNRPLTFMIGELFKVVDGDIYEIEAIIVTVPFGMPSGWNGEDQVSAGLL